MRIVGEWFACEDGVTRPVVEAIMRNAAGQEQSDRFLVDTGADRSAFSAAFLYRLRQAPVHPAPGITLVGIGGGTASVLMDTAIELTRDDSRPVFIRGEFAAFTDPRATDLSILGRDDLDLFDVIVSRRRNEVLLLAPPHHYHVTRA